MPNFSKAWEKFRPGFSKEELAILLALNTPRKIQQFLNRIPINFEKQGETCLSPRLVLRRKKAHCLEGALLAAAALRLQGFPPLIIDLRTARGDYDHVIAVFRQRGCWGAISKTNHAVLRYRDPVYRTLRELVMSYFHEYFDDHGKKTLRSYSLPVDLSRFDRRGWMASEEEVWHIDRYLGKVRHLPLLSRRQIASLKKPDAVEMQAGDVVEWEKR